MDTLKNLIEAIKAGKSKQVKQLVEEALDAGIAKEQILHEAMIPAMEQVSRRFGSERFYVPEVILAARAMNVGTAILQEYDENHDLRDEYVGTVVIGTVKDDYHDIGKNLVIMMLQGVGFLVHDLGYDVSVDTFVEKAEEYQADIICMSAMLTTTMPQMQKVIGRLINKRIRDQYLVMVGGAPVTEAYAKQIGADIYTEDAGKAAQRAKAIVLERGKK